MRVFGAAHLAIITGPASYLLSDKVGREFSVYRQAVRTFRYGLNFETDQPFRHPLALPEKIQTLGTSGAWAFASFLAAHALRSTLLDTEREARLPPFTQVRQIATRIERERASEGGAEEGELLNLALNENSQLRNQIDEQKETYDGLLVTANEESEKARREADEIGAQNMSLSARIEYLQSLLDSKGKEDIEIPDSFDQLEAWAKKYLSGAVFLHNRAIRAAKKSNFEDIPLAYKALLVLRDHYVPMRRQGGLDKKRTFDDACQQLGLDEEPSFATARYGEEGDAYWIEFAGERHLLDHHLKGKNSRDARFGFRLYYFWHDERQQVVVGWLPSHLPTRIS